MNLQKKGKKAFHQLGSLLKKRINKKKLSTRDKFPLARFQQGEKRVKTEVNV